jgi:hypothetical protein
MSRLGTIDTGGNMNPSGNLPFKKRTLVDELGKDMRGSGRGLILGIIPPFSWRD